MLEELFSRLSGNFWFQLTLLLAVAIISGFLFARFRQPKMIGQIILGIIIGPSVLGLISFQPTLQTDIVHQLALLGSIILLFTIGLECNIREIYTKRTVLIAAGGVIVPWVGGFLIAEELPLNSGGGLSFAQSVFVGAALVATSVAITSGVLREMKILDSRIAKTIIGAAVVDDVLGMMVLAISTGMATGAGVDVSYLIWLVVASVLFISLGAYFGTKFATRIISVVQRKGAERGFEEGGFLLALALAFLYAVISELIGISAIVGAFVAGTSFARFEYKQDFQSQVKVLEWVFAPIFFLSLGVLVDIKMMPAASWWFAVILTIVAFLTKVVGCAIPAKILGDKTREAVAIGVGMAPRMEVAMIIALYGLTTQIIDRDIYSVIIVMGILTTVFTPWIFRRIIRIRTDEKQAINMAA